MSRSGRVADRRAAVLGSPVAHSLSPRLHRAAYEWLGLSWTYDAIDVATAEVIGVVGDIVHLPGQDLLSVQRDGGREVLVPFVAELVTEIDVDAGRVTVDLPPGLLNLDELDEVIDTDEAEAPGGSVEPDEQPEGR